MKKLPKKICVKFVADDEHGYFVADTDTIGMVDMGETINVGVYKLIETRTVKGITEESNVKRVKK